MCHRVDGVDLVLVVEVGVEGVHHHDELLPAPVLGAAEEPAARRVRQPRGARRVGVDDEGAVEAFVDVRFSGTVAMVEVAAEGVGVELVDKVAARQHLPAPGTPSMRAAWMPWKWMLCGCEPAFRNRPAPGRPR